MRTKAEPPTPPEGASPIVAAYFEWARLKGLYRQGWLRRGVPPERCESVADHTFGVALLAMLLADGHGPPLDPLKVLRMALLHDLGEAGAGDWTPHDAIDRDRKHALERASLERTLGPFPSGAGYLELWEEYERGESAESRFVKQLDRLEMALQSVVYERQGQGGLAEFREGAGPALDDPRLVALLEELTRGTEARPGAPGPTGPRIPDDRPGGTE